MNLAQTALAGPSFKDKRTLPRIAFRGGACPEQVHTGGEHR